MIIIPLKSLEWNSCLYLYIQSGINVNQQGGSLSSHENLWCDLAVSTACLALCIAPGQFSRFMILLPSKYPSFRGRPWLPSAKVTKPVNEQIGLLSKGEINNLFF